MEKSTEDLKRIEEALHELFYEFYDEFSHWTYGFKSETLGEFKGEVTLENAISQLIREHDIVLIHPVFERRHEYCYDDSYSVDGEEYIEFEALEVEDDELDDLHGDIFEKACEEFVDEKFEEYKKKITDLF